MWGPRERLCIWESCIAWVTFFREIPHFVSYLEKHHDCNSAMTCRVWWQIVSWSTDWRVAVRHIDTSSSLTAASSNENSHKKPTRFQGGRKYGVANSFIAFVFFLKFWDPELEVCFSNIFLVQTNFQALFIAEIWKVWLSSKITHTKYRIIIGQLTMQPRGESMCTRVCACVHVRNDEMSWTVKVMEWNLNTKHLNLGCIKEFCFWDLFP